MTTETDEQKAAREAAEAEAAAKAQKAEKKAAEPAKHYAAYNVSLGKYVGGVRDTKAEAQKLAKGITDAGYKAEVREV
jgi:hypothetical protein